MSVDKDLGRLSFEWARDHMPVFLLAQRHIQEREKSRDLFRSLRVSACLHVSKETSVLIEAIHSLGADVTLVAANPLSSQDDVVEYLRSEGILVNAHSEETVDDYEQSIQSAARSEPDLIIDDGGELHVAYCLSDSCSCRGGTDETTSGTKRLRALEEAGRLKYPVLPVNEARTKHIFDNEYGSGQSALDGLLRATSLLIAGKVIVVAGYGWVGRGVADRARGLGARVVVTETEGTKALEAHLQGFEIIPMSKAAEIGDVFLTCTGQIEIIREEHLIAMKDGAILANVGHFDKEIRIPDLYKLAERVEQVRKNVSRFYFDSRKSLYLLCQGRVINLVAAEGHPPEVMQFSFANQLLALSYLLEHETELRSSSKKLLQFPQEIDVLVTELGLKGFHLSIDSLTESQKRYSNSFVYSP